MNVKQALAIGLAMSALFAAGCTTGKFSGKGQIPSSNVSSNDKAQFKFKGDTCEAGKTKNKFRYEDKAAAGFPNGGLKLEGEMVIGQGFCYTDPNTAQRICPVTVPSTPGGVYGTLVLYESINPNYPGKGLGIMFFQDNRQNKQTGPADKFGFVTGILGSNIFLVNGTTIPVEYQQGGPYVSYLNSGDLSKGHIKTADCKDDMEPDNVVYTTGD